MATFSDGGSARVHMVNLDTGEDREALMNPTAFTESVSVNYNKQAIPGLSHPVTQYASTDSRKVTGLELNFDRVLMGSSEGSAPVDEWTRFLRSLTVPPGNTQGVNGTQPAVCLFVWPNVLTMRCVVTSLELRYSLFTSDLTASAFSAVVSLEEVRETRITAEEYRRGA